MKKIKGIHLIYVLCFSIKWTSYFSQDVIINGQTWMTKNLNVTKFRNGDQIPQAKSSEDWINAYNNEQAAWCYYNNDPENGEKYGKLYNWYAIIDNRGLAPYGYHIPTYDELDSLIKNDGNKAIHHKLKQKYGWNSYVFEQFEDCQNCLYWSNEKLKMNYCNQCKNERHILKYKANKSGNGDNSTGFSALPGGYRDEDGSFVGIGEVGRWSSCQFYGQGEGDPYPGYDNSLVCTILNDTNDVNYEYDRLPGRSGGFSIRCIKNGPEAPRFLGKTKKNNGETGLDQIETWSYYSYNFELVTPGISRPINYSKIWKKDNNGSHEIENIELFGIHSSTVNKMINERLKWDFEQNKRHWNLCDIEYKIVDLNYLTIHIDDKNMYFEIIWDNSYVTDASSKCVLPKSIAEFELNDISKYILK